MPRPPKRTEEMYDGGTGAVGHVLVERDREGEVRHLHGHVRTPHGYVHVWAWPPGRLPGKDRGITRYQTVKDGWIYDLREERFRGTQRGIAIVAHRWIRRLATGSES